MCIKQVVLVASKKDPLAKAGFRKNNSKQTETENDNASSGRDRGKRVFDFIITEKLGRA